MDTLTKAMDFFTPKRIILGILFSIFLIYVCFATDMIFNPENYPYDSIQESIASIATILIFNSFVILAAGIIIWNAQVVTNDPRYSFLIGFPKATP